MQPGKVKQAPLDITKIPKVMRNKNWIVGAILMERWFKLAANALPKEGIPSTQDVKIDWVLSYSRAKRTFDRIFHKKIWSTDSAKKQIKSELKKMNLLSTTPKKLRLPVNISAMNYDKYHFQYYSVGGMVDMATGALDDLRAALARFNFMLIMTDVDINPIVESDSTTVNSYKVTINEIGIYVKDSYDFNDAPGKDQSLGSWNFKSNQVSRFITANDWYVVRNSDFRKWRQKNQRGGDYLIYSDIKRVKLTSNNTFIFKK